MVYGLILAGGIGSRMGGERPKQFLPLGEKPVLLHTLEAFEDCPLVDGYYLVCHPEHLEETRALIPAEGYPKLRRMVPGGATRQASCHRGLAAMLEECDSQDVVLVHDAARPLVTGETLIRCARTAETCGAANTVYPSENTMLLSQDGLYAQQQPPRKDCYTVQTPQGFRLGELFEAHEAYAAQDAPSEVTDDCGLYAAMTGHQPRLCLGNKENIKITTPLDLALGQAILQHRKHTPVLTTARIDVYKRQKCECVVTDEGNGVLEIKNIATVPEYQGKGYAKAMIDFVVNKYKGQYTVVQVGTGDSPLTIPFYEKCGFVYSHSLPNFFIDNYDHPIFENGIQLVDMVYLKRPL